MVKVPKKFYICEMKKYIILSISFFCFVFLKNLFKQECVVYIPFNIPGSQMAATIPPFGIFIESKYSQEGDGKGSILAHERIHWLQYQRLGLLNFYYEYFTEYFKHGRVHDHWMEVEARKLSS
jgi:hypothetical protein